MTEVRIAAIVGGHGECEAVPILVRRIAQAIDPGFVPKVLSPLRVPASRLLKEGEIERSVNFAARKAAGERRDSRYRGLRLGQRLSGRGWSGLAETGCRHTW